MPQPILQQVERRRVHNKDQIGTSILSLETDLLAIVPRRKKSNTSASWVLKLVFSCQVCDACVSSASSSFSLAPSSSLALELQPSTSKPNPECTSSRQTHTVLMNSIHSNTISTLNKSHVSSMIYHNIRDLYTLSIYLSICLSVCLSVCLSIYLFNPGATRHKHCFSLHSSTSRFLQDKYRTELRGHPSVRDSIIMPMSPSRHSLGRS